MTISYLFFVVGYLLLVFSRVGIAHHNLRTVRTGFPVRQIVVCSLLLVICYWFFVGWALPTTTLGQLERDFRSGK